MGILVEVSGETVDVKTGLVLFGIDRPQLGNGSVGPQVPRSSLTKVAGDVAFTSDNQVIEGLDIAGNVSHGNFINTRLRHCVIRVGPAKVYGTSRPAIASYGTRASGRLIEFCAIEPSHPSVDIYGITGYGFKVVQSSFIDVVDITQINHGGDYKGGKFWGCYGETKQYDVDPRQNNTPTHGDFAQIFGGTEVDLWGNTFVGKPLKSNGIIFTPTNNGGKSAVVNPKVRANWLYSAYTQISAWANPAGNQFLPIDGLTIKDNRHFGSQSSAATADHRWDILLTQENFNRRADISGNVKTPSGAAAHIYINN